MNALRLDRHRISEAEGEEEDILSPEVSWGALDLSESHDIWHDDEGLFAPGCAVATIGSHRRVPLPVYILGHEGERSTSATMSVAELAALVRDLQAIG